MNEFNEQLSTVISGFIDGFEELIQTARLSSGASQETHRIEIQTHSGRQLLAMRRAAGGEYIDPEASPNPGLVAEAKLMQVASAAGVPEPTIYHVLQPKDQLGSGFIMGWLEGETLGTRILRAPELNAIRPRLAYQCGEILARIHAIDTTITGLDQQLQTIPTADFVNRMWGQYQLYDTSQPMVDYTARWLLDHLPDEGKLCLTHSDFRNGNLMVTPAGITAVLDWEVAHIGDPIRDLGWICTRSWRFGQHQLPVGGFGQLEDLLAGYEAESGRKVELEHVHFWEVFGSFWWAIGCLKMADHWRHGPDQTVERPGIARRSSECQMDCANLIIPGSVELVQAGEPLSSIAMPDIDELLSSVYDFLRTEVRAEVKGRTNFMALVASNSLAIVKRELLLAPQHLAAELARLQALLSSQDDQPTLCQQLANQLRDGTLSLDTPGLKEHLRTTVANQLAIDQPKYPGLATALSY